MTADDVERGEEERTTSGNAKKQRSTLSFRPRPATRNFDDAMSLPRRSARASTPTSPAVTAKKTAPTGARKSSSGTPAPLSARPALPLYAKNTLMADWKGKLHKVKSQTLRLGFDDETILIARVKCPVPKNVPGYAALLEITAIERVNPLCCMRV